MTEITSMLKMRKDEVTDYIKMLDHDSLAKNTHDLLRFLRALYPEGPKNVPEKLLSLFIMLLAEGAERYERGVKDV